MVRQLLTSVLVVMAAGCGRDIVADSAALDRALVPAVDFTSRREWRLARSAMSELVPAWAEFRAQHYADQSDSAWRATFDDLDTLVSDVADLVEDGDDLAFAAENLVEMRMMLADLRDEAGIEYFPDYLGELWEPIDEIGALVMNRDSTSLTDFDRATLTDLAEEAAAIWEDIAAVEFDTARYGFDAVRAGELQLRMNVLAGALVGFEDALAGPGRQRVLQAARALRPEFMELYRLFGDYSVITEDPVDDSVVGWQPAR